jgi:hypothetical protein
MNMFKTTRLEEMLGNASGHSFGSTYIFMPLKILLVFFFKEYSSMSKSEDNVFSKMKTDRSIFSEANQDR